MKNFFVYKFLDKNKNVLYIGQTTNLIVRIEYQHFSKRNENLVEYKKKWIHEVNSIEYVKCISHEDMELQERFFINKLNPKYNKKHNKNNLFSFDISENWKLYQTKKNDLELDVNKKTKIISIINPKGGVGKTTTSIHLGASFAEKGKKTLLIDFDAQRNLSIGYKIPKDFEYTSRNFLDGDLSNFALTKKNENLYILAGDREIENGEYKRNSLAKNLKALESLKFDYVIIDCPPRPITEKLGLGEIALAASDYVISPIEAEEYSIAGINKLLPSINRIRESHNKKLVFLGFFFNKVIENTINFRKYRAIAQNEAKDFFFKTYIRQDVAVEKAKSKGETVFNSNFKSCIAKDYILLADEILNKTE